MVFLLRPNFLSYLGKNNREHQNDFGCGNIRWGPHFADRRSAEFPEQDRPLRNPDTFDRIQSFYPLELFGKHR